MENQRSAKMRVAWQFPSHERSFNMDLSLLPPNVKLMILGHSEPKLRDEVLRVVPKPGTPVVPVFSQLRPSSDAESSASAQNWLLSVEELQLLETRGYIVKDNFSSADLEPLRTEVITMKDSGILKPAGMNTSAQQIWNDPKTRGDLHHWLNDTDDGTRAAFPHLDALLSSMDTLRAELNERCNFESSKTQTQIACYPGHGARYVRHLDSSPDGPDRRLTCLFYLNKDWVQEHGGSLRIFLPVSSNGAESQETSSNEQEIDIEPLLNRLVLFQSRTVPHEVLPAFKDRMSITMWFY